MPQTSSKSNAAHTAEPFPPPFSAKLIHPRHWPIWLLMGIWFCISQLPLAWQYGLGRTLGRLLLKLGGNRVKVTQTNINRCLPELTTAQQQALLLASFENAAIGLIEVGIGWWLPDWRLRKLVH
ncbi:MAG: hypothetical protein MI976_30315, partial [Pseudomonadales bacterium]|nr:hypothetical protein [Pseudomonadales bacterium]